MSVNRIILQGRIPFDLELKNGDNEKKAFLGFSLSVKRNYKPEGEQYYPEDLLFCKSFGQTAIFIDKYFNKGDNLIIEGELRRDDDYEKEGETVKGQMYVHITPGGVHFQTGNVKDKENNGEAKSTSKKTTATRTDSSKTVAAANSKKLNPLSKKKSVMG